MDESWVGDKVLARLGGATPQGQNPNLYLTSPPLLIAAAAANNTAPPVAKNDLLPPYSASPYPRTMSGYELHNMGGSPIPFQGRPASSLHQAQKMLSFPAPKGQMTGYGVAMTQLPEIPPLSSEPTLIPDRQRSNTLLRPEIHLGSTSPVAGSPLRSTAFPRPISQSHPASPMQCEHSTVSHSVPHSLASVTKPSVFADSPSPGNLASPSEGALSTRPSDCFYIDTAGSPRLRPSLRSSDRLCPQKTDIPRAPKMQVGSIGVGSMTHDDFGMFRPLGHRMGNAQRLPIRSATTEMIQKTGSAASNLARQIITAPSQPRAMREIKGPESKAIKAVEGCGASTKLPRLREVDLAKWPCRTCQFVHRGSECETVCIGCGSNSPDRHDLKCPYRNKKRLEDFAHSTAKQEGGLHDKVSFNNAPSDLFTNSVTTKLSVECQKRGFNPEFRYYGNEKTGEFMADLRVKDKMVSGEGRVHRSQKEARDFLAEKGLKVVLMMDYLEPARRSTVRARTMSRHEDGSFDKPVQSATREPSLKHHLAAKARTRPGPPPAETESSLEYHNRMDVDKSDEGAGKHRAETSSNTVTNRKEVASLPTNVSVRDVPGVIDRILSNGPTSITFNLPANVSTDIAEAYGRGFAMVMHPRRRTHSRSRSRSPARDRPRIDRDYRERDEYYNRPGRLPVRDEYRPARDEYRVIRDRDLMCDRTRKTVGDARLRLSPPADLKSQRHIKEEPKSPDSQRLDRHYRN
jgi:hypothetical protein